jgi:hypothetical protein
MNSRREHKEVADAIAANDRRDETSSREPSRLSLSIETTELMSLRQRLGTRTMLEPSEHSDEIVRTALMAAVTKRSQEREPSMQQRLLTKLATRTAGLSIAGLLLAGSVVSASAAFGGQALSAVGITSTGDLPTPSTQGIDNAPTAAATGATHADEHAFSGSGNASTNASAQGNIDNGTPTLPDKATEGINNAPDAAATGATHADEHASKGAANANAHADAKASVTSGAPALPTQATAGITNAPEAAATGVANADAHASLGAGNAAGAGTDSSVGTTVQSAPQQVNTNAAAGADNSLEGIENAPEIGLSAGVNAALQAGSGSGNAPIAVPTPAGGSALGGHATVSGR